MSAFSLLGQFRSPVSSDYSIYSFGRRLGTEKLQRTINKNIVQCPLTHFYAIAFHNFTLQPVTEIRVTQISIVARVRVERLIINIFLNDMLF